MSIVQGGPGLPIFPEAVLNYFSQGTITGVQIEADSLPPYLKFLFEQVILIVELFIMMLSVPILALGSKKW